MLKLSHKELEAIGNSVLLDFYGAEKSPFAAVEIDRLATEYLGLKVIYRKLSDFGQPLGLTTFSGVLLELRHSGGIEIVSVSQDTILLEYALLKDKRDGRRRFTVAHECAHQILIRLEIEQFGESAYTELADGKKYSCRELMAVFSWEEWQANALGAVLLMPETLIRLVLYRFGLPEQLPIFNGGLLNTPHYNRVCDACAFLDVSFTAFMLRLKSLGLLEYVQNSRQRITLDIDAE